MKKYFSITLFCFFLLLTNNKVQSQEAAPLVIESKFSYAEKIYLQLSSSVLTSGNTVWFKTIVTDLAHTPTRLSSVLHVDLIDFNERIVDKKLLKIEYGIADGFFDLKENMKPGRYLVRAYTEWNKNFESEFISQTYIDIYEPNKIEENKEAIRDVILTDMGEGELEISAKAYPELINPKYNGRLKMYIHTGFKTDSIEIKKDKDDHYTLKYRLPKDVVKARLELKLNSINLRNSNLGSVNSYSKIVAVNKEYLDLQFFPEGGNLVEGLTSKIAFKALDYNNKGKIVKGYIVDQNNEIIIPFQSNILGMGVSYITPEANKTYYASVKNEEGVEYKYALPEVEKTGVVLKVKEIPEYIVIALRSKNKNEDIVQVKVQSRGVVYDNFSVQIKGGLANTGIEKSALPEGIVKITVQNKMNEIVCERLFFNFKEEERIAITAIPNLKKYSQRDKIRINLSTKDQDNNAIVSNLSVLVVDKDELGPVNDTRSHILAYFLLNSELKGTIETSSSYFNKQNKSRKRDMDALLLTQGWSNYKYKKETVNTDFEFLPEKKLSVSGTVMNLWTPNKPLKKPIELTMIYGPLNVDTQHVEGNGKFNFQLKDYYKDNFRAMIQSKTKRGKKTDVTIDLNNYEGPKVDYKKEEHVYLADSINTHLVQKQRARNQVEEEFKVENGTVGLDEVTLTGYNLTPEREKMLDLHGPPDVVIENEELRAKTEKWHSGLFSLLESSYPDDIRVSTISADRTEVFSKKDNLYARSGIFGFSHQLQGGQIESRIPFSRIEESVGEVLIARDYQSDFTFIVIDGIPVNIQDYALLNSLPIKEIKSVELINEPKHSKIYVNQVFTATVLNVQPTEEDPFEKVYVPFTLQGERASIINIYTYAGMGLKGLQRSKGIYNVVVSGFATKREFYTPKYEDEYGIDSHLSDIRSVVHWAPDVNTDIEGNTQVEFYNGDNIGEVLIIIEGITEKGKIGYYETTYNIDKKQD